MSLYYDEATWNKQCEEQARRIESNPKLKAAYEAWCEEMDRRDREAKIYEDAYIDELKAEAKE